MLVNSFDTETIYYFLFYTVHVAINVLLSLQQSLTILTRISVAELVKLAI